MTNQQNLIEQKQQSSVALLPLKLNLEAQKILAVEIHDRFHAMRTYGKAPESLESVIKIFIKDLEDFILADILRAIKTHSSRSPEFFTTADIISLIRRNGRPSIKESDIIAIRRKEICDWTREEAKLIDMWEVEQNESWSDIYRDLEQEERLRQENDRLRLQVKALEEENSRAWAEIKTLRFTKGIEKPSLSQQEKIANTVTFMRANGAPESDVQTFLSQYIV